MTSKILELIYLFKSNALRNHIHRNIIRVQFPIDHNLIRKNWEIKKNRRTSQHSIIDQSNILMHTGRHAVRLSVYKFIIMPSVDFCRVIQIWRISPCHHRSSSDMNSLSLSLLLTVCAYFFPFKLETVIIHVCAACLCVSAQYVRTIHSTVAWNWRISTAIYTIRFGIVMHCVI